MIRVWADQIRFNKPREYIPRGYRLFHKNGIKEWNGEAWIITKADEVAILSTAKVKKIKIP